jgi:hypothetical protein
MIDTSINLTCEVLRNVDVPVAAPRDDLSLGGDARQDMIKRHVQHTFMKLRASTPYPVLRPVMRVHERWPFYLSSSEHHLVPSPAPAQRDDHSILRDAAPFLRCGRSLVFECDGCSDYAHSFALSFVGSIP